MYNLEKRSAILENVAGFARLDAYIYGSVTKWPHRGMFIHWGNKIRASQMLYESGCHQCRVLRVSDTSTRPRV